MNYKRLHIINGAIFIVLLAANLLIYKNRDDGYAYKEFLSYNQLYQPKEIAQITGFNLRTTDSLEILVTSPNQKYVIKTPDSTTYPITGNPIIKLKEGKHIYTIQNTNKNFANIELGLNFVPEKTYKLSGLSKKKNVELYYCNTGIFNEMHHSLDEWIQKSQYTTDKESALSKKLLKDSIKIETNESSVSKIEKIALYILKHLDKHRGIPNDELDKLSPLKQFDFVLAKKSKLWCGNYANIFSFLANSAGIKTRLVCTEGKINEVYKSGHSFNECYIKEFNQWVMVDLTSKMILAKTGSGKYLNTLDIYNAHLLSHDDMQAIVFDNDSLKTKNYNSVKSFYDYYFNPNSEFIFYLNTQFNENTYSAFSKIKRYISKAPTFATYSGTVETTNEKFYIKQSMLFLLLSFLIYWMIITAFTIKRDLKSY